jgi:hypothetical protein
MIGFLNHGPQHLQERPQLKIQNMIQSFFSASPLARSRATATVDDIGTTPPRLLSNAPLRSKIIHIGKLTLEEVDCMVPAIHHNTEWPLLAMKHIGILGLRGWTSLKSMTRCSLGSNLQIHLPPLAPLRWVGSDRGGGRAPTLTSRRGGCTSILFSRGAWLVHFPSPALTSKAPWQGAALPPVDRCSLDAPTTKIPSE